MARRIEQGSILGFVLVGAVLVGLLVGGIYLVRHNTESQTGGESVVSDNKDTSSSSSDNKDTSGSSGSQDSSKSDDELKNALDENRSTGDGSTSSSSQNTQSSGSDSSSSASTSGSSEQQTSSTTSAQLPQTGPADTYVGILGATLLAGTGFAYARSRNLL